jgi:23S rRNA (uracil1939-C5)-methyltransferase
MAGNPITAAVVNPPRAGCASSVLDALAALAPRTIAYVSCKPATLARDLKRLTADAYDVDELTPVDMLPLTPHIEALALLSRRT